MDQRQRKKKEKQRNRHNSLFYWGWERDLQGWYYPSQKSWRVLKGWISKRLNGKCLTYSIPSYEAKEQLLSATLHAQSVSAMVAFSLELETVSCWDEMSLERFKAFKEDMTFVIFLFCYLCEKRSLPVYYLIKVSLNSHKFSCQI